MSSLLVFTKVYRLEVQSDPCCELLQLYLLSDLPHPSPPSQSVWAVGWGVGGWGGGVELCCRPYSAEPTKLLHHPKQKHQ
jgi:hypothetical protein